MKVNVLDYMSMLNMEETKELLSFMSGSFKDMNMQDIMEDDIEIPKDNYPEFL